MFSLVLFSSLSLPPSLNQDCMYIFDKTITKYTKEIMSVSWSSSVVAHAKNILTISGKIITILDTAVLTFSLVEIIIIITQYITYSNSLIN